MSSISLIKTLDNQSNLNLGNRVNSESANRFIKKRDTGLSQLSDQIGALSSSELRSPRQNKKPKLEDFEVGGKIGAGTFGVIKRAVEKKTKKEYALKMISKAQIQSREHAEHIVREKKVIMYLSEKLNFSPYINRAFATFHDEKNVYIQIEFVKGCDLLSRI